MASLLTTFLAAFILAYVLRPITKSLQGFGLHKSLSAIFTVFFGFLLILGLNLLLLSVLQREFPSLRQQLPIWLNQTQATINPWLNSLPIDLNWVEIQQIIQDRVSNHLTENANTLLTSGIETILNSGQNLLISLLNFVLIIFVMFYLLADWEAFFNKIKAFIPRRYEKKVTQICVEMDALLSQYLRGQLSVMVLLAIYYSVGLHLLGITGAIALGIFTGIAIIIPYLGFTIALGLACMSAVLQVNGEGNLTYVLGLFLIGQVLEGFFLTPKLVGERIGLHPVVVIFALMLFGNWFGFFGILLALPISAITLILSKHGFEKYKASSWYRQ